MFDRRFFAEAVTLVLLAGICGSVANVVAARDRKLAFVGDYPNATTLMRKRVPVTTPPVQPTETTDPFDTTSTDPLSTETVVPDADPLIPTTPPVPAPVQAAPATTSQPPVAQQTPAPKPRRQFLPTPDKVSDEITNEDARQLFDDGALFLDARRTAAFHEGHIPGARSFPVWESDIDERVMALFSEVTDQQQPIVIYCTGGNCEDSHMLAQKLWGIGYENLLVHTDGFPGWLKIGGAVER